MPDFQILMKIIFGAAAHIRRAYFNHVGPRQATGFQGLIQLGHDSAGLVEQTHIGHGMGCGQDKQIPGLCNGEESC